MKRSGISPGTKGFAARSSSLRRGALQRNAEKTRQAAAQRSAPLTSTRKPVTPEERRARKLVRARSQSVCELCGRERATNFQHRQNKSQLGGWTAENGLDVCGQGNATGCHGRIHQSPAVAYERGWSVRSTQNPADVPVWLAGKGWSYLTADGGTIPAERSAA